MSREKDGELAERLDEAERHIKAIKHSLKRTVRDNTQLEVINLNAKALLETSREIEMITQYLDSLKSH